MVVYVDDIVITRVDCTGIYLSEGVFTCQFSYQRFGATEILLAIEVERSDKGSFLSQRKYALDLLEEIEKLGDKPCCKPMVPNVILLRTIVILLMIQTDIGHYL